MTPPTVVTLGTFDGVHVGHQRVLADLAERAAALGGRSILVTFDPHPLAIVAPERMPGLLTPGAEQRAALAETGLDRLLVLRFDAALAALDGERFVREVLQPATSVTELVVGHDHGFGRGRSGDIALLQALGRSLGFSATATPPVTIDGQPVSSSRIRALVAGGELDEAARLLGRPYSVTGRVVRGDGRGRQIGVPTINLGDVPAGKLLPPDGVYAAIVEWSGGRAGAMLNQGGRPTFADGRRTMEAHLFGVTGDLYDSWVRVTWVERLRDVRRFGSVDELTQQLSRDREAAIAALARRA